VTTEIKLEPGESAPPMGVSGAGARPESGGSVARLGLQLIAQLPGLLFVDLLLALVGRRSMGVSVGRRIRRVLAKLGPMYDKLAQLLASHAVLSPGALLEGYQLATPAYPPVSWKVIQRTVATELGPVPATFRSLANTPFRTTATAQYHLGVLLDGTDVAVKVRRPGLKDSVPQQAMAAGLMTRAAGSMMPTGVDIDRAAVAGDLLDAYAAQLDFRHEAAYLLRMAAILAEREVEGVVIPAPIAGMVTDQVLVSTYLGGNPVEDLPARGELAARAARVLFASARSGLFPSDLRPAHLLAMPDGALGIVELEDCQELSTDQVKGLDMLFAGIISADPQVQVHGLEMLGAVGETCDRRQLRARLEWLAGQSGDVWGADPLHGVPIVFKAFVDGGITMPLPLLRLAENMLYVQALAAGSSGGADLRAQLVACGPMPEPPAGVRGDEPTDDEIAAASIPELTRLDYSWKAVMKLLPPQLRPRRENLRTLLPIVIFIPINILFGIRWAIAALTVFGLQAVIRRLIRREPITTGMKISFLAILALGAYGIFTGSAVVIFLPNVILPVVFNLGLVLLLVVNRPLYGLVTQFLWPIPANIRKDPIIRRPTFWYSTLYTTIQIMMTVFGLWLLLTASANTYVAVNGSVQQLAAPISLICFLRLRRTISRQAPRIQARLALAGQPIPLLQVRGLDFSYGPVQVLFDVDLDVWEGEVVALLGTNGAGKSTLLRAVTGLSPIDRGVIRLAGRFIDFDKPGDRLAHGIVHVPGGRATFPNLSVHDNLRARGFSVRRKDLDARIARAIDPFPVLAKRMKQSAGSLSGGEQQMLALAGATLLDPRILLIDELSLGLAPIVVEQLLQQVVELKRRGLTIVIVEQSVNVALSIADRAVFMEKGQVRFEGPSHELLERDDLVRAVFLGAEGG
jgi:ABC-type branched-subunit amino acid transport system ATPase component/predicted unusual protein kinase regulating ubiquinone biosynthesis (AarF/ABC1/UbiB family)